MASRLTFTADATKKGAIVFGIAVVAFIVLRYSFRTAYNLCCVRPTPTPTPYVNTTYGVLPPLALPENTTTTAGKSFNLETIDGTIPESTGSGTIYEILKKNAELDYQQSSERLATGIGFPNAQPLKISDRAFLFQAADDQNKKVEIDFIYYNIKYSYDNLAAYVSLVRGATATIDRARSNGLNFLYQVRPELRNDKTVLETTGDTKGSYAYLDPTIQQTNPVASQLQANLTKVNIPRQPINGIPIISPYTTKNLINFTYTGVTSAAGRDFQDRLVNAEIMFWPINKTPQVRSVYPLRSTQNAWDLLTTGNAVVLSPPDPETTYNIRAIYLAYYEPPVYQPYMQPVWVFEGDKPNDSNFLFRAIVPAVQEGYIQQ